MVPTVLVVVFASSPVPPSPLWGVCSHTDPTDLTVNLLEKHLLAAETSVVAVGAARGTPRTPLFEGCSPSPLAPSYASAAALDILGTKDVRAASAPSGKRRSGKGKGGKSGGGGSGGGGRRGGGSGGVGGVGGGSGGSGGGGGGGSGSGGGGSGGGRGGAVQRGEAAALGASESALPGTAPAEALHTFTLDSDASRCFFRDSTTLIPLPAPVTVRLADPSGDLVLARSTTVLPCPAVLSGSLSRLHLPSFSTNMVIRLQLRERFREHLPVLRLHSDRGGEFSSDLLRDFCRGEGILQSFTLPASPHKNGVAEHRIGLVMEVARTSMIHVAAPYFLWPFAVRHAAHQLNLWPRVSLPETSPTPRWTGKVDDASVFRVWGSCAFVRDTSVDKLSSRAISCVFLGFVPDAPGWLFYRPTSRRVLPSQDVTFDEARIASHGPTILPSVPVQLTSSSPCTPSGVRDLCPSTPMPTGHSLSAPPSDESVEPSGPYPELVGCLMYLMTCTRPDLAYPLSILARYVTPGRHRPEHWEATKRVLRYLCSTSGMGLVLGGRGPVVLTGHADAFWVDDLATQRSSQGYTLRLGSGSVSLRSTCSSSVLSFSCEVEIYAGAMAAQELRWLTYMLTDLGERPHSPPVLYVDNKAMIALCQEHRLEHRTKHTALRYFLARKLQQRGQLRLAYVATWANTADILTKALQPCDHQRFCTVLGLFPVLSHLLTA
ncbi:unnamed protein product [Closterium sp. NIES-54]